MDQSSPRGWRVIDHTADIGLEIEAEDLRQLFERAADGLFEQIAGRRKDRTEQVLETEVTGLDWPDLMFNWLRELLYLWTGRQLVVAGVHVRYLTPHEIRAEVQTAAYDPSVHRVGDEIKAVTYHQLQVEQTPTGWRAQVIFDV